MTEIKKILIATDFSESAEKTYPVAQRLASVFGSRVDLIHVIPTFRYLNESIRKLGAPLDLSKDLYPRIVEESRQTCRNLMSRHIDEPNRGEIWVKVNRKASEAIVQQAEEGDYDLIVIAARGTHTNRMLRGGTTERVIRHSPVPVFCIDQGFNDQEVSNIMVPTDTSKHSFAAFPVALALAELYNSSLTLFHVVELYGSYSESIPRQPEKGELVSIYEGLIDRLNQYLSDEGHETLYIQKSGVVFEDEVVITEGEESRTVPLETKIEKGLSAHFEIEQYAEENADLVVIATHGHSGLAHFVLGSTSEKVAQYVSKPVLTVRPTGARKKKEEDS